ncbi:MAG TPA: organomercurial lyase [Solirubrobacteraceae bacterium]|nr:organomercurial lyase [Solirubrobacteraceae bacterium]
MDLVEQRRKIYQQYAATGEPPKLAPEDLVALEAAHAVVLGADGTIAFANPFATPPAPYRIQTSDAIHYAICAWDALGVLAALGRDGVAEGRCPDCGESIVLRIREGTLDPAEAVVHFLVPAANWYEDLGFT